VGGLLGEDTKSDREGMEGEEDREDREKIKANGEYKGWGGESTV
jgi:hypothetical protein